MFLLGCNVTAYVKESESGKAELLYAHINNENEITKIPAIRFDGFNGGILYYTDEKGNDEEIAIKLSSVAVIFNGILTMVPSADDFKVETGSIELINNDGDKDIDVVTLDELVMPVYMMNAIERSIAQNTKVSIKE